MPTRLTYRPTTTAGLLAAACLLWVAPTGATAGGFSAGAPGLGDPYFPMEGNGGYDVDHYDLAVHIEPKGRPALRGTARITARATQDLDSFDLDLQGLTVRHLRVDGHPAAYHRDGQELVITPPVGIRAGHGFTVTVTYDGTPAPPSAAMLFGSQYGWIATDDGVLVATEPDAASTWFPSNDHPRDKATYALDVTVPSGLFAVSNGELVGQRSAAGHTTYQWRQRRPMATYLATATVGHFDVHRGHTPAGVPLLVAVDPRERAGSRTLPATTAAIVDYWSELFGRYPFDSTGGVAEHVPDLHFSLETQNRPLYGGSPPPGLAAHELAHQWFGDSLTVRSWSDTWLNEGFATFGTWLWSEHTGGNSAQQAFDEVYAHYPADAKFWQTIIAAPGRSSMFASAVYQRGAMTLQALRRRLGDATFFRIMRTWTSRYRYGTVTTADFVALAESMSGQDLRQFFQVWLFTPTRPALSGAQAVRPPR